MSHNPFSISSERLAALCDHARSLAVDGIISAQDAEKLVLAHGLAGIRDLMLLLLDVAKSYAQPPISNFFVGAVGLESPSGDLILGGNVEFPGTHLAYTLHGEGFVATRAFNRGADLAVIAIGEAHPCAHCRQYLSEFAASRSLELIDPLGHTLTLAQLYPWPFDPDCLGEPGAVPAQNPHPELALAADLQGPVADALVAAARHAHAPYSKCPGAIVLELSDGRLISGASVESVAFNPTVGPLQAALVELLAAGRPYSDIVSATLGTVLGGAVDYSASTCELLGKIAPDAPLSVVGWTV
jgi:cytidine deaminase